MSNATFNSLKINTDKSCLVSDDGKPAIFVERIDKEVIEALMNTADVLKTYSEEWAEKSGFPDEYHHLKKIYISAFKTKKNAGELLVEYSYSRKLSEKGYKVGRIYPKGSLSLGSLRRKLRGTLTRHLYYDIDIKNAHPTILLQLFLKAGIRLENLRDYVLKRDEILGELMETLNISRRRAKDLFLIVLYGGRVRTWIEYEKEDEDEHPIPNYDELSHELRSFIDAFEREVNEIIIPKIMEANPDLLEVCEEMGKENPKASLASLFAQNVERMVLETAVSKMGSWVRHCSKQRRVHQTITRDAILCFDGVMVLKSLITEDVSRVCKAMSKSVKRALDLDVEFVVKEPEEFYNMEELNKEGIPTTTSLPGALELCEAFLKKFPGCVKTHTDGRIKVYDMATGHWSDNKDLLMDYVIVHWDKDNYPMIDARSGEKWGDCPNKLYDALMKTIPPKCRDNDWFEDEVQNNSKGKILLRDGWYDFQTDTFHEGFTPDIVFHHKANIRWKDAVDMGIKDKIYKGFAKDPAMEDNQTLEAMLHYIARAISGSILLGDRNFLMGTGRTTSGKGTLAGALRNTFGGYVEEVNCDNFCVLKGATDDEEKRLKFLVKNPYARVVVCSEKPPYPLDATLIKRISGGDRISGRLLYKNSLTFTPHFTIVFFNNSVDDAFNHIDEALLGRLRCWKYDKSFRSEVNDPETQLPIDPSFKLNLENNPVWARAFFEVLREAYKSVPEEALKQSRDLTKELSSEMDATMKVLNDYLILTDNYEDFVLSTEMRSLWTREGDVHRAFATFEKLNKALNDRGFISRPYKKRLPAHYRDKRGYFGIKIRERMDIEEEEKPPALSGNGEVDFVRDCGLDEAMDEMLDSEY